VRQLVDMGKVIGACVAKLERRRPTAPHDLRELRQEEDVLSPCRRLELR
jgi:hypothetical protein